MVVVYKGIFVKGKVARMWEGVGLVTGRESPMVSLSVFPHCRFNFYIKKAQKQTFKKILSLLRRNVGLSSDGKKETMYIVYNAFASLKYSPTERSGELCHFELTATCGYVDRVLWSAFHVAWYQHTFFCGSPSFPNIDHSK